MAKGEPLLRDLRHEDTYQIVEPHVPMPEIAAKFAERPDDAILVHDRKKDKFLGVMYLYDFKHYGSPPRHVKAIHKATVGQCAKHQHHLHQLGRERIPSMGQDQQVQAKGCASSRQRKGICWLLSSKDLWEGLNQISELEENDE